MFARYGLTGALEVTPWAKASFPNATIRASANTVIALRRRYCVREALRSPNVVCVKLFIAFSFCRALLLSE